jgi:hypothetical protein
MEAERASHERAIAKLESQRESAWSKADELKEKLADLQELAQALGDQSAADILGQLDELKRENAMLKRSLEQSDTSELQREIDYTRRRPWAIPAHGSRGRFSVPRPFLFAAHPHRWWGYTGYLQTGLDMHRLFHTTHSPNGRRPSSCLAYWRMG